MDFPSPQLSGFIAMYFFYFLPENQLKLVDQNNILTDKIYQS